MLRTALTTVFFVELILSTGYPCRAQSSSPVVTTTQDLAPSEELKAALAPYVEARAQPNDLTEADSIALGVAISRAGKACHKLEPSMQDLNASPSEMLAFAQLCIFGLQYQPGLDAARRYIEMPNAPERESALLLTEKALIGLKDLPDAATQLFSIESEFPYDAPINSVIDQLIETGTLSSDEFNAVALALCGDQIRNTLPVLEAGNALSGKDFSLSPGSLFADDVRCFEIERALHNAASQTTLAQLQSIIQLPIWKRKAEFATMEAALARAQMVGMPAPLQSISGKLIGRAGTLSPYTLSNLRGTNLFVVFTLWSSNAMKIVQDLRLTFPQQSIYMLTSWTANTGATDEPSSTILDSLRVSAKSLPARIHILVVPDSTLERFHVDTFPVAIVIRGGIVEANIPTVGDAGERLPVLAMDGKAHLAESAPSGKLN